ARGRGRAAADPHRARRGLRAAKPMSRLHLPTSLGARLSLAAAVAVAVAVALASVVSYFAVRAKLFDQVDQQLETRADVVNKVRPLLYRLPPGAIAKALPPPEFGGPQIYGQLISPNGELVGQSGVAPTLPVTIRARHTAAGSGGAFLAD